MSNGHRIAKQEQKIPSTLRSSGDSIDSQKDTTSTKVKPLELINSFHFQDARSNADFFEPAFSSISSYICRSVIGEGAFGIVYHAVDSNTQQEVALKVARPRVVIDKQLRQRFFKETALAGKLNHPGIVKIIHAGEDDGKLFIAMELCRGVTLADWLRQNRDQVSISTAVRLLRSVAVGVEHGHINDVVHRDLKPANIMVLDDVENPFRTKILDFGLACQTEETIRNTSICAIVGTPLYMAPERITGKENETTTASDIYSLGAILYECLTGLAPCLAENVTEVMQKILRGQIQCPRLLNQEIPEDLAVVCMKCLAYYPEDRYESVQKLIADLDLWIAGETIKARPLGLLKRTKNWLRDANRHQEFGIGLVAVNLLVLGWAILNYPLAMVVMPAMEGDRASQQMFAPVLLLIIPIHSVLLWSSIRIYQRRLSRKFAILHLVSTLLLAAITICLVCFTMDIKELSLNRFERVAAFGLMSTFAEVQSVLLGLLLYFGEWKERKKELEVL